MEHKEIGIYRLVPQGEIFDAYFDHDTQTLGPYSFQCRIGWEDWWHESVGVPHLYHLYRALLWHREALCAFFINNDIVAYVLPESIHFSNIYKDNKSFDYLPKPLEVKPYKQIGFVKTCAKVVSVGMAPFVLPYDEATGKACVHGEWIDLSSPPALMPCPISAYSELVKTGYEAVYYSTNNDLTFI